MIVCDHIYIIVLLLLLLLWLRIGTGADTCECGNEPSSFHKIGEFS